jgi:hypothetical protein
MDFGVEFVSSVSTPNTSSDRLDGERTHDRQFGTESAQVARLVWIDDGLPRAVRHRTAARLEQVGTDALRRFRNFPLLHQGQLIPWTWAMALSRFAAIQDILQLCLEAPKARSALPT